MGGRQAEHAEGDTGAHGREQEAEAGVTGVQDLGGERGPEGDDHAAPDEPRAQADEHRTHDRAGADEPPALSELGERLAQVDGLALLLGSLARDDERGDEGGRHEERGHVGVDRHRFLVEVQEVESAVVLAQPFGDREEEGGDAAGQRERPVGGRKGQGVGRRELLVGDEVRDRCLLRWRPQQAQDLEQEGGEKQLPDRVEEGQRRHHNAAPDVAGDHDPLAVPPVDEDAAHRPQEEARDHAGAHHKANGRLR